jgi:hypothetical protein
MHPDAATRRCRSPAVTLSVVHIAVTGSVAMDHLMRFSGRFAESLLTEHLDRVALSFTFEDLQIRRGGTAANICFGLAALGLDPLLVVSVGEDFAEYGAWLERHGVQVCPVRVSRTEHTARFTCTTDAVGAQIGSFYSGAMAEARHIELQAFEGNKAETATMAAHPPRVHGRPPAHRRHRRRRRGHGVRGQPQRHRGRRVSYIIGARIPQVPYQALAWRKAHTNARRRGRGHPRRARLHPALARHPEAESRRTAGQGHPLPFRLNYATRCDSVPGGLRKSSQLANTPALHDW